MKGSAKAFKIVGSLRPAETWGFSGAVNSLAYSRSYDEWQAQKWGAGPTEEAREAFNWVALDIGDITHPGPFTPSYGGALKRIRELEEKHQDAAVELAKYNYFLQKKLAEGQSALAKSSKESGDWAEASLNKKQFYEFLDAEMRYLRTKVSRLLQTLKTQVSTEQNAVLNYPEKAAPIRARFQRDFRDALSRLTAASEGLEYLFGYAPQRFPEAKMPPSMKRLLSMDATRKGGSRLLDDCVLWVRDAIAFVVRFSNFDQGCSIPLSLKNDLLTADQWTKGLNSKSPQWEFELRSKRFERFRHARLRGLSVYVVGATGLWQAWISVPKTSECWHRGATQPKKFSQDLPDIFAGRVTTRENVREPDILGGVALYNASPIGKWTVQMSPRSLDGSGKQDIRDIQIDLHLAMQAE